MTDWRVLDLNVSLNMKLVEDKASESDSDYLRGRNITPKRS